MKIQGAEFPARVTFVPDLRDRWPTGDFIVEARLGSQPWSLRIRPWSPPDDTGTCMAYVSFLMDTAPWTAGTPMRLTVGPRDVGSCIIQQIESIPKADLLERDFLDVERGGPVRAKAA
jgi:hypothetical protein